MRRAVITIVNPCCAAVVGFVRLEAVYIGDFIFQGALRIANLKDLRFDLLAAWAYMSRYPGIKVPLQPRPAALPLLTN